MAKSVILLGKGTLACRIAEWFRASPDYALHLVVPVVPEPTWTKSLIDWCTSHHIRFVETGRYRDIPGAGLDNWSVDLLFSVFYDRIIPPCMLDKAGRCLNLHNGPLPRYRGVSPINWALKNEERMHGVTIHEMTAEIDAGAIVSQVLFNIDPECDEVIDVYKRALAYGHTLFIQTMPILERIPPTPQDESEATYFNKDDAKRLDERANFTRDRSANALTSVSG